MHEIVKTKKDVSFSLDYVIMKGQVNKSNVSIIIIITYLCIIGINIVRLSNHYIRHKNKNLTHLHIYKTHSELWSLNKYLIIISY